MGAEALRAAFRERLSAEPRGLFPVIIEIALDRNGASPYDDLGKNVESVSTELKAQIAPPEVVADQKPVVAPYVFATLHGSRILQLAEDPRIVHITSNDPVVAQPEFDKRNLVSQVVAEPLGSDVRRDPGARYDVIIHLDVHASVAAARTVVVGMLGALKQLAPDEVDFRDVDGATHPYVFASLTGYAILGLVDRDRMPVPPQRTIYRIWEDSKVHAFITESVATVKADAARIAFSADGKNITWAVLDTGVDETHPHFKAYGNLVLADVSPLKHRDFRSTAKDDTGAVVDANGHGTHVAGIIAGSFTKNDVYGEPIAVVSSRNEAGSEEHRTQKLETISGMAPRCKLVSLRVLEDDSTGVVSSLITAIDQIQQWNDHGRTLVIHGVNLSLGYPFEAEWFACGQSPLCVEIDRLVQSGVVVVVAAGNSGYGYLDTEYTGSVSQGIPMSINDPGNSAYAITVGSTHRTEPHRYGVSYFSSKGPTGDGRLKPDLLAPGERIISCASTQSRTAQTIIERDGADPATLNAGDYNYKEDSGTSMAAPHVSGIIAGFLSIRREYIGKPWDVKEIFMRSATDLGRDRRFQGAGLVDLMRAIQSV